MHNHIIISQGNHRFPCIHQAMRRRQCIGQQVRGSVRKFLQSQDCRNLPGVKVPLTDALGEYE